MNDALTAGSTLLKADEVDAIGTLVANPEPVTHPTSTPTNPPALETFESQQPDVNGIKRKDVAPPPARPTLRRDKSLPPPQLPPPPAPFQSIEDFHPQPLDSVTMAQLMKLMEEVPKTEPAPYDFEYEDFSSFEEEIEEFIGYREEERDRLHRAQTAFARRWAIFHNGGKTGGAFEVSGAGWLLTNLEVQKRFLENLKTTLLGGDKAMRSVGLVSLLYLVLGCWKELEEMDDEHASQDPLKSDTAESKNNITAMQLDAIRHNVRLILEVVGAKPVLEAVRAVCLPSYVIYILWCLIPSAYTLYRMPERKDDSFSDEQSNAPVDGGRRASWSGIIVMYLLVEVALRDSQAGHDAARQSIRKFQLGPIQIILHSLTANIVQIEPSLLNVLTDWLAESRWDDSSGIPACKVASPKIPQA